MAYLLICVRTDDTLFDKVVFSKDLAPVKFDTSEMGLAFRHDPCTNSAQYFVIHNVSKPQTLHRNRHIGENSGNRLTFKDHEKGETRQKSDVGTSKKELETSSACTCSNGGNSESPCKACDAKSAPKFSLVLLDIQYKIVTKLKSDIAHTSFKEVVRSPEFREGFMNFIKKKNKLRDVRRKVCICENVYKACSLSIRLPRLLEIRLEPAPAEVCYSWNDKVGVLVQKRMILEETMAWLSTLGGGYSSLGDYFLHFSEEAGKISVSQLKIAMEMGDPIMAAKCRLFYALSLMQRGQLHQTKKFIKEQYDFAMHFKVRDQRLIDMCKGLWSKLKYMYVLRHKEKLNTATSKTRKLSTTSEEGNLYRQESFELGELEDTQHLHEENTFNATYDSENLATSSDKEHVDCQEGCEVKRLEEWMNHFQEHTEKLATTTNDTEKKPASTSKCFPDSKGACQFFGAEQT